MATGTYSYRNIWKVAYPILISLVMEQLIGLTDTAFMGRVGEVELGASAIAIIYYVVLFMIGFGFSIGAQERYSGMDYISFWVYLEYLFFYQNSSRLG